MVIIRLMGGLGNQLQQYAFYRKLIEIGVEAKIDTGWFLEERQKTMATPREMEISRLIGVNFEVASEEEISELVPGDSLFQRIIFRVFKKKNTVFYEDASVFSSTIFRELLLDKRITRLYTIANFTNEIYYSDILPLLRKEVVFPIEEAANRQKLIENANEMEASASLSVHIRRGDYLNDINRELFGGICTEDYYEKAIKYCVENADVKNIFFFSDDVDYATEYSRKIERTYNDIITKVVDINHGADNMFDIYLMSKCHHNITANSTFSFWGARFNENVDKIMIRPTKHVNKQPFVSEDMKMWWKGWIFVSPTGELYK